jgi:hypothetical protein
MKDDVIVRYDPFNEIVILECIRFSTPDDLARFANITAMGKPAGIYWAQGVAFLYYSIPPATEAVAKAMVEEKRVYWAFVSYALMPKYQPLIETKEKIIVPVIDMSQSSLFQTVSAWLKEQK